MSSGTLPLSTYHRAQSLGSGSYGSVLAVYDDDGAEFALKLFVDDDDDDDSSSSSAGSDPALRPTDPGALREISVLRLLRASNAHPHVIELSDVKTLECHLDDGDDGGAGTRGAVGLAMPAYPLGTLGDAVENGSLSNRRDRVAVAYGLLSAVAFLHANGILHRDVKADNVLLDRDGDGGLRAVLIDFSLAKVVDARLCGGEVDGEGWEAAGDTHTPAQGTPTYRAPEVAAGRPYGLPSDLYSAGVVLLETVLGRIVPEESDGKAARWIAQKAEGLPDAPLPDLVRGLLRPDPRERTTAAQALENPLFQKFGFASGGTGVRRLDLREALPLDESGYEEEGEAPRGTHATPRRGRAPEEDAGIRPPALRRRMRMVRRLGRALGGCRHPLTAHAALCYSIQMEQLDDAIDLGQSQILIDCVILAMRFFETELVDVRAVGKGDGDKLFENWSYDTYLDNEATIWMLMDFCLYPRRLYGV